MNKKVIIISGVGLILALSAIFLLAFNKPELTPSQSFLEFHEKALEGDIQGTKQYVADDVLQAFENGAFPHYGSFGGFITDYQNKNTKTAPKIISENITGDTAKLEVKQTYTNREATETYYMIKEEGTWKIAE